MAVFTWGPGGTRMTPEDIAAQRKVAQALMAQGMDYSPVASPWQGAARMAQALLGGYESGEASYAAKQNSADSNARIAKALDTFGGGGPTVAPAVPPAAAPVSAPMGATTIPAGTIDPRLSEAISGAATANGVDPAYMTRLALVENGGKIDGTSPLSSASGPFQFINSTAKQYGLTNPADPAASATAAARLTLDNKTALTQALGREPTPGELYLAHQQGAGGAAKLLANPDAPVESVIGIQAARNNGAVPGMTAGQFANKWTSKFSDIGAVDPAALPVNAQEAQGVLPTAQAVQAASQPARPAINPAIIKEMMTSPYASETEKKIGSMLFNNLLTQQAKANDPAHQLDIQLKQGQVSALPLDRRSKELANQKAERELLGEGAQPLTADERTAYGIPAGQPAYKTRSGEIKFGPAGTKITNNVGDGEGAFAKEAGKATAQRFNDLVSDGQQARQLMSDMNTLLDLGKGIGTGKAAQVKAVLGPFAEAAGLKVDGLSDIQAYEAIVNRVGPSLRVKGSGAQSDYELKNFLKSIPTLGNTQEGNEMTVAVMNGLQQNKVRASEIASKALAGEITRTEAEKQLRELPDPMQPYRDYKSKRSKVDSLLEKYGGR